MEYLYGIGGLDATGHDGKRIIFPGPAPRAITVVTGIAGSGMSIFLANVVLGLARCNRRVCVGSWDGAISLERIARIHFGVADDVNVDSVSLTKVMKRIATRVSFIRSVIEADKKGPFFSVDLVAKAIKASKCDVFVADAMDRFCDSLNEERRILFGLGEMARRLNVHLILTRRQNLRAAERSGDCREGPTRGGIKGSSAWEEIADTIFGIHRPSLWRPGLSDDKMDVFVLKQRRAKWPFCVQFDADFKIGSISDGRLRGKGIKGMDL